LTEEAMCGRYTLSQGEKVIEAIPNVTIREDLRRIVDQGRFNIAPTQDILVVIQPAATPEAKLMRWGLIPHWAKDPAIAGKLINARAETLAQKPAFRQALQKRRCVIPADGFYEWRKNEDGTKTPIYTHLKSRRGFAFAGLWETWADPRPGPSHGTLLTTCTIITTPPNPLLAPIHNRMPAMLSPESARAWLDPRPRPPEELLAFLQPFPAGQMDTRIVSRAVNSAAHDGPDLITPVEDSPSPEKSKPNSKPHRAKPDHPIQKSLF
jgi:putative SOS response-associated peptidase YedK